MARLLESSLHSCFCHTAVQNQDEKKKKEAEVQERARKAANPGQVDPKKPFSQRFNVKALRDRIMFGAIVSRS